MRILNRYILGELAAYLLIALFFLTFLLLLNKIFQFTDLVVNRGVPLSIVARFLAAALPVLLLATLPMATLIACVMAFSRLSSDSEFVAMTASGMSLYSQLIPVGAVGAAAAVLSGFLMIFSLPWSQSATAELRRQILHGRAAGFEVRERIFNDRFDGVMIYAREIESPGKVMKGIMISDAREAGKSQVIFADHGMIVKSPASPRIWLRLVKGTIHTVGESGKVSGEKGDAGGGASAIWKSPYRIARFETYDLNVDLTTTIGKAKALQASLRSYPLRELRRKLKEEKPGNQPLQSHSRGDEQEIRGSRSLPHPRLPGRAPRRAEQAIGAPRGLRPQPGRPDSLLHARHLRRRDGGKRTNPRFARRLGPPTCCWPSPRDTWSEPWGGAAPSASRGCS